VHARAVLADSGFGMKARGSRAASRLLHDEAVGEHVVGHVGGVREADVDLVLRGADLVVVIFHRDAHLLERADRVAPDRCRGVHRRLAK